MDGIGTRIREARKRRKLSQTELARRVGLHRVSLANIERGTRTPSLETLFKLARALKVAPARLLNG